MNEATGLKISLDSLYEGETGHLEFSGNYWVQKSDQKLYEIFAKTNKETGKVKEYIKPKWMD